MYRLLVVGGGRMGEALLTGLLEAGWASSQDVAVVEVAEARRKELASALPGVDVIADVADCQGAIVAVKPTHVPDACNRLAMVLVDRVLSIAAGIRTETVSRHLRSDIPVVRAMPNTASLVHAGVAAIAPGETAREDDLEWSEGILRSVGTVVRVREDQLDAVTGLSGSGPAWVFHFAESLIEAGVLIGLSRDVAEPLVLQTIAGSAQMMVETGEHPATLRNNVTSPGGTTAAGLRVLEERGIRGAILLAIEAAAERSAELGSD